MSSEQLDLRGLGAVAIGDQVGELSPAGLVPLTPDMPDPTVKGGEMEQRAALNGQVATHVESSATRTPDRNAEQDVFPVPGEERTRTVARADMKDSLANVYHDAERKTVTLLLDENHATAVIYAVRALAADYEAHAREVRLAAASLPSGSYGAENRAMIAIRHERIASRLRRVESRYRAELAEYGLPPQ